MSFLSTFTEVSMQSALMIYDFDIPVSPQVPENDFQRAFSRWLGITASLMNGIRILNRATWESSLLPFFCMWEYA